ncbi:MAG: disulfide oxidoreductase [Acidimicrobiia bacterium]
MSSQAIRQYNTLVALLSLVVLVAAIGLLVYRLVRGRDAAHLLGDRAIWLAWLVALVSTAGSLFYSDVIGFEPCRLCWFQRIAMYPMAIILLVGAIRRDRQIKFYALPLALGGLAISVWHYLIQALPALEGGGSCGTVPCSARYVEVFGFISIPFMAGAGFIVISVLLALYTRIER